MNTTTSIYPMPPACDLVIPKFDERLSYGSSNPDRSNRQESSAVKPTLSPDKDSQTG